MSLMTVIRVFVTGLALASAGTALAQSFPVKPIRIVTYPPGGGTDFASRLIAQGLTAGSGWQVVVDNRPGGVIQGELLAAAPADGYTLLLNGSSLWLAPFMQDNVPYDPVKDFAPITLAAISPNILVAHPLLPVKSVRELIALAKARPADLNYGSGPTGTPNHLAGELLKVMAGINIVRVNYKGIGPALTALIAGEVQLSLGNPGAVAAFIKARRLKALAVTSAEPSKLFPELLTVAAAGLHGFEVVSIHGIFAPAKTPAAIVSRLNQEIVKTLNHPEVKEKFSVAGTEAVGSSPEQLAAKLKSEMATLGKIIRDSSIRGN